MTDYNLDFISQVDFEKHVTQTIRAYQGSLSSIDLKLFNKNIIDPIKLVFDKNVYNKTYEEIIKFEIQRQRDKSNNNAIGYFHQNIFKYINGCKVPKEGWDIIFNGENMDYYVELKNKHNTMNSSSSSKTYMRFQNHLLTSEDKDRSICALVEVIANHSQNIPWVITLDKVKQKPNEQLRRISIDKFYEIVTGNSDAFRNLCFQLPKTIEKIVSSQKDLSAEKDTVISELKDINPDLLVALYQIAFETYDGFIWK